MRFCKFWLVLCFAYSAITGLNSNAQANVTENQSTYLYVDGVRGSDSNSGAPTSPLKTIQAAINKANTLNHNSIGVRVVVRPGIYREFVNIAGFNLTTAPLTVEASTTGAAIIAGSDLLTGWTQESPIVYSTNWTANLGTCAIPSGWPTDFAPVAQHAEMVFVDGTPLTQVMAYSDLRPGTFFVGDAQGKIYVSPAAGSNLATSMVEAAKRTQTLDVVGRTNVVVRGLVFRHAANCINTYSAEVYQSANVLVDSIQADWNNWGGFGVFTSDNVTVQNSVANHNGGVGMGGANDRSVLFNFNESDYNNWRGAQAAFYDWGMGGTKLWAMHGATVQNHYSYNNQAQGLWFDTDNKNISISNATLSGNVLAALQIERNEGPLTVQNSHLCNSGSGAHILTSQNVTIQGNTIYNNGGTGRTNQGAIFVAGQPGGIFITDWETGQNYDLFTTGTQIQQNTIVNGASGQFGFGTYLAGTDWTQFATTLTAGNNTWYDPITTSSFKMVDGKKTDLGGWQAAVGTDFTSTWTAPSTSPAADCAAPPPAFADFSLDVDGRAYTMSAGTAVSNIHVNSFGYGTVNLQVSGVPTGVTATLSQQSMVSGTATLTFLSSMAAVAHNVPITVWGTSGSRVHSATFYLQVYPAQLATTVTWAAPQPITYGTPLGAGHLNAVLSVPGNCAYTPSMGTVLAPGTRTLTASCTPADTFNYSTPAPVSVSITVTKAPLTITAPSFTLPYHSAVPAITPIYSGFVNGETSASLTTAPSCSTAYYATVPAGSSSGTSCWGAVASNYSITYVPGIVTVVTAAQTITFNPAATSVKYGASALTLSATASSGLTVTFAGTAGVCSVSGTSLSFIGVGTCTVTAMQTGNSNYLAAPSVVRTMTVCPAPLTITASSPTAAYGAAVPAITPGYSGFANGNTSASLTTPPTCTTAYTTTSAVGSSPATTCSGAASPNYSITYVAGQVIITKSSQTITIASTPASVSYGVSPITLSASASSGLPVTFSAGGPCSISGSILSISGVGTCTATASQSGNTNYSAAPSVVRTFSVAKAPLTINAPTFTIDYHSAVPTISPIYSGFLNGDTSASLTTAPSCSTAYYASMAVGSTAGTSCWGAAAANYSITYVAGTLTVVQAAQTITFAATPNSVMFGNAPLTLSATASSGLAVSFSGTAGVCTVSGTSLTVVGAGNCAVTASQPGNANYLAAGSVSRMIAVSPAPLTITASSATVTYGSPVPPINPTYSGFVNGNTSASLAAAPVCTTSYTPTSPVGSSPSTICSGAASPNYAISCVPGKVTVNPATQTPTPLISLPPGTYTSVQTATISDSAGGAIIYYTTDGTNPTTNSSVYAGPISIGNSMTLKAIALASASAISAIAAADYTVNLPAINFDSGFNPCAGMQLNGKTSIVGTALQLTDGGANEAASAFFSTPVNVAKFSTSFTLQQTAATGDGMMFVIQNAAGGAKTLGPTGSSLGYSYGPTQAGAILNSVGIKFDLYSNSGEGTNSTGLYLNGTQPTKPALDMTASGVDLHSGHAMSVQITYDGTNLNLTITDTVTLSSYSTSWTVNIPQTVGSSTAYVGFTASTGGATSVQQVLKWTF
jgi:Legume lectin domain/Chitobiase/beta-hexosaminidase C-terminal domain/MBG domain (YGX type)/Right handed beta helix region